MKLGSKSWVGSGTINFSDCGDTYKLPSGALLLLKSDFGSNSVTYIHICLKVQVFSSFPRFLSSSFITKQNLHVKKPMRIKIQSSNFLAANIH